MSRITMILSLFAILAVSACASTERNTASCSAEETVQPLKPTIGMLHNNF